MEYNICNLPSKLSDQLDKLPTMENQELLKSIALSPDSEIALDLYRLYRAQEDTDFAVTVNRTPDQGPWADPHGGAGACRANGSGPIEQFLNYKKTHGAVKSLHPGPLPGDRHEKPKLSQAVSGPGSKETGRQRPQGPPLPRADHAGTYGE